MRFLLGLTVAAAGALAASPQPRQASGLLRSLPLRFEQDARNRWISHGPGYALLFDRRATYFQLGRNTLRLDFQGSNTTAKFEPLDAQKAPANYFIGRQYRSTRGFSRLRRSGIYPGIDLVYYGSGDRLEYDFNLAPGADPSRIHMHFEGADGVSVNARGDLVLKLGSGEVVQQAPVVYQRRASGEVMAVESRYRMGAGGDIGVVLGDYDPTGPVVIDPALLYTAYLTGANADAATAIAIDPKGFIYLGGFTYSVDFPAGVSGPQVLQDQNTRDAWIMKLNPFASDPNNVIVYGTFFGGNLDTDLKALAVDANGLVYFAGTTLASNFPVTSGAYQSTLTATNATDEGFVAVLDTTQTGSASLVYASYYSGSMTQQVNGIASRGGVFFITGWTNSTDLPVTGNAFQATVANGDDAFVAEFDPSQSGGASLVFASYLGGYQQDVGTSIDVDAAGLVYVAGFTLSTDFPTTPNAFRPAYSGGGDGFLAQIDPVAGAVLYATYVGGSDSDVATNVIVEPSGHVAIAGYTFSTDLPITPNAAQPVNGGNGDAFVMALNLSAGSSRSAVVYGSYYGGDDGEVTYGFSRDAAGRYYICGYTLSQNLPVTASAANPASMGQNIDGFVAVLDPARALTYASYITGPGYQIAHGVASDASGNAYVTGLTTSDVFLRGGAIKTDDAGNIDVFFMVVATLDSSSTAAPQTQRPRIDVFGGESTGDPHRPVKAGHR